MSRQLIIFALFWVIVGESAFSQAPQAINYQAVVRNSQGAVLANQLVAIRLSIHESSPLGVIIYREQHLATTNNFGLVNLMIGTGNISIGQFSTIDWAAHHYFVEVELDISGGSQFQTLGTQQLLSVPYALYSEKAGNGFSGDYNDLSNVPSNLSNFNNDVGFITNPNDADADPTNELQTLSMNGDTLSLSNGNAVLLPDATFDGDSSTTNEIQVLSISGDTLRLSNGGLAVVLPDDHDWMRNGSVVYNDSNNIGIGTNAPSATLDLVGSFQYQNGNEGIGKVLVSDSFGNATWDSLAKPFTFEATIAPWSISGSVNQELIYCADTIVLSRPSLVVVSANGHIGRTSSGGMISGIVFPGESLYAVPPSVFYTKKQGIGEHQAVGGGGSSSVSTTRTMILPAGTHIIQLRFYGENGSGSITMYGASISGFVLPIH